MIDKKSNNTKQRNSTNYESADSKLKEEIYRKCISTHKWALGIIVSLVVSFVFLAFVTLGYLMWRGDKEYKEACAKASQSCENAKEYESKAQEALVSIEQSVVDKLKQIEETGNEQIQTLFKEAERQRAIQELFAFAQWAIERKKHEYAAECYKQIVEELKEEDIPEVYNNWGAACLSIAKQKKGPDVEKYFEQAKELFLKAKPKKTGIGAYNLACLYALQDNEVECQRWLKLGEEKRTLPAREFAMADEDLKIVRDKNWFVEIRWKDE